jgi:hypothetical protein
MRCRLGSTIALAAALLTNSSALPAQNGNGQRGAAPAKAAAPADPHDLSGIWLARGTGIVMTNVPPMTPAGQAKFNANKPSYGPRAIAPALGNDPMGNCDPLGLPRLLFFENNPWDFEFVQASDRVMHFFDRFHVYRMIWTDGRELPKDPDPRWMGYSVGKWEGDTFMVDSVGFDDRSWIDHFGQPHSDQMHLEERYRRADHDTLEFTMSITDPKYYTRTWTSEKKVLKWQAKKEFSDELFCVPSEEQAFNRRMRDPAGGVIH